MAFRKIGILSIGEMGFHWAKLLKSHNAEVLTYDKDRGEVSRKRGQNAGVKATASMAELVQSAELIVSIVVPSAAKRVAEHFGYVGVLTIEFFVRRGQLVANEMAPRVHNSGHWTIEGAETSQFENHVRAIAGLPLGSTRPRGHSAMINLIGEMPPRDKLLGEPALRWHDYGKSPRPGRKLGHLTVNEATPRKRDQLALKVLSRVDRATWLAVR